MILFHTLSRNRSLRISSFASSSRFRTEKYKTPPYTVCVRCCFQGFTLIEILLSITIVAILGALLVFSIQKASMSAKQVTNLGNLRTLAQACLSYANDHNGYLPQNIGGSGLPSSTIGHSMHDGAGPRRLLDWGHFEIGRGNHDYLSTPDVFYSPFAERMARERVPGTIFRDGGLRLIGYFYIYQTRTNPAVSGIVNEHLTDNPNAPIFSDLISVAVAEEFSADRFAYVRLDGSVHTMLRTETPHTLGLGWVPTLKKMAGML